MTRPSNNSEIAAAYNDWAETYDSNINPTRDLAATVLKNAGLSIAGRHVIEVGCGTGRNTAWLAQQANTVVACDFSDQMLARARNRVSLPHVQFIQHDIRNPWPLPGSSADLVVAMLILEHVENLPAFFAEAARVLKNARELFICELHPMRQLAGGQAQFSNTQTGERKLVTVFLHDVSEYVNAGLAAGLELMNLGEWRDEDAERSSSPRLLSVRFRKRVNDSG
jgi:ubiquinone/menaquinone biosynthesis C-methylase UbiE